MRLPSDPNAEKSTEQDLAHRFSYVKRTAWLPVVEKKSGSVFASKFSGLPLLAENENWPCCANCQQAMPLFLQLNASELPAAAQTLFGDGIVQIFYCTNTEQECDLDCEAYLPFAKSTLLRRLDPARVVAQSLTRSPVIEPLPEKVIVAWQATDDYPCYSELFELGIALSDAEEEWLYEQNYPKTGDKLCGWPDWIQGLGYPHCLECGDPMRFIFQIDSKNNLDYTFGNNGCAYICQCAKHPDILAMSWASC